MSIGTVLAYLFGSRRAILQVAACPGAERLGFLLVMSAGFAREYDGESLLDEPWHLLLPLAASLILSAVLFLLVAPLAWRKGVDRSLRSGYRVFLRLFWMTAPLAWLYAIPVERLLSAGDATRANLWILAVVSLWRVCLMARVLSVLFNARLAATAMPVLLFADTVAQIALFLVPLPVISLMGGIRLTESEQLIQGTALMVRFFGILSWPVWLIGTCVVFAMKKSRWELAVSEETPAETVSPGLWVAAVCSLAVWVFVLPVTQPEQQRRHRVEADLLAGRIAEATVFMSRFDRADFPSHWDPPPRLGYGQRAPSMVAVIEGLNSEHAPWVRSLFYEKLTGQLGGYGPYSLWFPFNHDEIDRVLAVIDAVPEGRAFVRDHPEPFERLLRNSNCTDARRSRVEELLEAAGHEIEVNEDAD